MARSNWNIYIYNDGWVSDGTIYRPNDTLRLGISSTQQKIQLADGDNAFVTPENKYNEDDFTLVWYEDDGTVKNKIETYVKNNSKLKIVDHLGNEYIGRFVSIRVNWIKGISPDRYDIEADFMRE